MNKPPVFTKTVYCHHCRAEEAPLIEPVKKRLVRLVCTRCGNSIRVQYVPRKRNKTEGEDGRAID